MSRNNGIEKVTRGGLNDEKKRKEGTSGGEDGVVLFAYLDTEDALSKHDVTECVLDVVLYRLSGGDHVAVDELHGLCSLCTELATY